MLLTWRGPEPIGTLLLWGAMLVSELQLAWRFDSAHVHTRACKVGMGVQLPRTPLISWGSSYKGYRCSSLATYKLRSGMWYGCHGTSGSGSNPLLLLTHFITLGELP